jgi:hypothetical protein
MPLGFVSPKADIGANLLIEAGSGFPSFESVLKFVDLIFKCLLVKPLMMYRQGVILFA